MPTCVLCGVEQPRNAFTSSQLKKAGQRRCRDCSPVQQAPVQQAPRVTAAGSEKVLECPVCLMLPEGEVHQCNEGHCCCVGCWKRLDPRRCPECRQPLPQANRNRAAERAIAALEWSCEHCGEATTRGAKAAHLFACPQWPTTCAARDAGCDWAGVRVEQAAHESGCTFVICQRMMAPLQARNQQLQWECHGLQELRARVEALEPLQAQNKQLQRQVAALQQRVAAPSDAEVAEMGLTEATAALWAHRSRR